MTTTTPAPFTFDLSTVPADDRERVAALIPEAWLADAYVHRTIEGVEDFTAFDVAVLEAENVLLAGPTGSAKTSVFRAYAAARRMPFVLVEGNASMDPGVIVGKTTVVSDADGNPVSKWVDGDMTLVFRYGGVILFDEVNMTHQRVMAAFKGAISVTRLMTLPEATGFVHGGRGGLDPDRPQPLLIGAAYNPRYQGTTRLNEALINQFGQPLEWGYDHEVEEQLITSARLLHTAEGIRALNEIRSPVSTNMLMEFERHALNPLLNLDYAIGCFVRHFAPEEQGPVRRSIEANSEAIWTELTA